MTPGYQRGMRLSVMIPFAAVLLALVCSSGTAFGQSCPADRDCSEAIPLRQRSQETDPADSPATVADSDPEEHLEENDEAHDSTDKSAELRALEEQKENVGIGGGITLLAIGTGGAATGAFFGLVFLGDGDDGFAHIAFSLGAVGLVTMAVGALVLISAHNRADAIQKKINVLERSEPDALHVRPDVLVAPGFVGAGLTGQF